MGRQLARTLLTLGYVGLLGSGCAETAPSSPSAAQTATTSAGQEQAAAFAVGQPSYDVPPAPAPELDEAEPSAEVSPARPGDSDALDSRSALRDALSEGAVTGSAEDVVAQSASPSARLAPQASSASGQRVRERMAVAKPKRRAAGHGVGYGLGGLGLRGSGRGGGGNIRKLHGPVMGAPPPALPVDREDYAHTPEASFVQVADQPLSTFSADVDTASYSNLRRLLRDGRLPPADAVRVEEMLNYFDYRYGQPDTDSPFAIHTEVSDCPWNDDHRLVHIGLETQAIEAAHTPARNLVFLLDVSGSMSSPDKLPLLKQGMGMLARNLRPEDTVSVVVYAGASGLALEPTAGDHTGRILDALERLEAGGSTAGAAGIELAYRVAQQQFVRGGINRVILATDGDFNVGVSSQGELARLIEKKRESGIFLTVLGFGTGNLQDSRMETLADKGNGNYAYIDSGAEAHKVLVREAGSTLVTVAKDVKLQVEFNPAHVASYKLIGYENRTLAARDFNDDAKDAGEVGAGHSVTALYEVVPRGVEKDGSEVDALRYQGVRELTHAADSGELMTLKVRYKRPDAKRSHLVERPVVDAHRALRTTSDDFRFAAAVAGFGLKLRGSDHGGDMPIGHLRELAEGALGDDPHGDRRGLLELIDRAAQLGLDG